MTMVYCEHGSHDVDADDIARTCDVTGEAICWDCWDRECAEILEDIHTDRERSADYEAALLRYHPETTDWFGEEAPF